MIDTHYHLDQVEETDLERLLVESREGGIKKIIAPSTGLASLMKLYHLKDKYKPMIEIAAGFHPERNMELSVQSVQEEKNKLLDWIEAHSHHICAIGEIGIPYYSLAKQLPKEIPSLAWEILHEFLVIAKETDLPVILHAVYFGSSLCLQKLKEIGIRKAVFHWLKTDKDTLSDIVRAGYFVSVTPEVVCRKRDQELVKQVPLSQLLVETDGPYPLRGPQYESKLSHPLWIRDSINMIAYLHSQHPTEVKNIVVENAYKFFNLSR